MLCSLIRLLLYLFIVLLLAFQIKPVATKRFIKLCFKLYHEAVYTLWFLKGFKQLQVCFTMRILLVLILLSSASRRKRFITEKNRLLQMVVRGLVV